MKDRVLENIRKTIMSNVPAEAGLRKIEFEGPYIVLYIKNPEFIATNTGFVRNIAKTIKKRVIIKIDESTRKDPKEAKKIILKILDPEAGVEEKDILFDDVFGEVIIKATKPGLVIGDDGKTLKQILVETGWRPKVVRKIPQESKLLEGIRSYMLQESDYRLRILRNIGESIHRGSVIGNKFVKITALGGFREVGRSAILVETAESKVLLDFGLNPGVERPPNAYPRLDALDISPEEIDAVIISHAHIDHCGLVPLLFKYGYRGPVYATEATRDLMTLLQLDILDLAKREGKPMPYTHREVQQMVLHTIPLKYGETTDITPDIKLTFYNAGHILGSAMVHLHIGNGYYNILYTGDMKYQKTRLLDKADTEFPRVDALIIESTYGTTVLPPREEAESKLIEIIKRTIERGGKVLIPTLSVGRSQEIMLVLREAFLNKKLPQVPVYIEGMIDEVTAIHMTYPELLAKETFQLFKSGENPFTYETFVRVDDPSEREEIIRSKEPSIIMATSGMMTGGPVIEYFKHLAPNPLNTLIFVNYQVQGTLGRKIKDGAKEIMMHSEDGRIEIIKVAMEIYSIEGFSGHSDRDQLISFLTSMTPKPKTIILNHGEESVIESFGDYLRKNKGLKSILKDYEVIVPSVLDTLSLKIS
ncbi:MAG: beta-CASP ribonuclease aCPSF1 [Sulfolobales archaeon]|jgi:KH/beta-lactamase-domain protein